MKIAIAFFDKDSMNDGVLKTYVLRFEGGTNPRSVNDATLTLLKQTSKGRQVIEERAIPVELINYTIEQG